MEWPIEHSSYMAKDSAILEKIALQQINTFTYPFLKHTLPPTSK